MFNPKTVAKVLEPFQKAISQLDFVCVYHQNQAVDLTVSIAELQSRQQESLNEAAKAEKLVTKLRAILE